MFIMVKMMSIMVTLILNNGNNDVDNGINNVGNGKSDVDNCKYDVDNGNNNVDNGNNDVNNGNNDVYNGNNDASAHSKNLQSDKVRHLLTDTGACSYLDRPASIPSAIPSNS